MVQFAEIVDKTVQVRFTRQSTDGYAVEGTATYNKENQLTNVSGNITNPDNSYGGNFSAYKVIDEFNMSLNDFNVEKHADVCEVVKTTLEELKTAYTEN